MAILEIAEQNFTSELEAPDRPALLEFTAPWCVYCRKIAPALDRIARKYEGEIAFGCVNIDDEPALEERFQVDTIPSLFLRVNGTWSEALIAPSSQAEIEDWMRAKLEV